MKEAALYESLDDGTVRCNVCQRRCFISEGKRGYCQTRLNRNGKLVSSIYAQVASLAVSPIEKKPVYHFYPGSMWLSLGSLGCNFRCPGCQNWELSFARPDKEGLTKTSHLLPEDCISLAKRYNTIGISWTYNEPTLWFEYTLDTAKLAKENHLCTNYVTNGYITPEALDTIGAYLDVFRVDIKGFNKEFYKSVCHLSNFEGILEVTERAKKKWNMHVEIVTNLIPTLSDDEKQLKGIAHWIYENLGPDTPWHITRFFPHLELSRLSSTPIEVLEQARSIGLKQGLRYVYLGNVPAHPGQNTYCHNCHRCLIEREDLEILSNRIVEGRCPFCSTAIPGRFGS